MFVYLNKKGLGAKAKTPVFLSFQMKCKIIPLGKQANEQAKSKVKPRKRIL